MSKQKAFYYLVFTLLGCCLHFYCGLNLQLAIADGHQITVSIIEPGGRLLTASLKPSDRFIAVVAVINVSPRKDVTTDVIDTNDKLHVGVITPVVHLSC
jgi:hypothetical protein